MKFKYIFGILIIVVFIIFASMNFQKSLTPYVSLSEAMAKGKTVQVKGERVEGSEAFDMNAKTFNFRIRDKEGQEVLVIYNGVKPSNFERAKEIVAKGRYHAGAFEADELLVKCPSKYEAENVQGVSS